WVTNPSRRSAAPSRDSWVHLPPTFAEDSAATHNVPLEQERGLGLCRVNVVAQNRVSRIEVSGQEKRHAFPEEFFPVFPVLPDAGVHRLLELARETHRHCLLGSYRIATAPEPNSSRLTSLKSTRFESPANNVGPWPASLGWTTNSYSSITPSSANASGSVTPPVNSPLPGSCLSCRTACPRSPRMSSR